MWLALLWQMVLVIAGAILTLHLAMDTVATARNIFRSYRVVPVEMVTGTESPGGTRGDTERRPPTF
jgi:hypothetical protein